MKLPTAPRYSSRNFRLDTPDRETGPKAPIFDILNNYQNRNTSSSDIPRRKNTWLRENIIENTTKAGNVPNRTGNTQYKPYSFDEYIEPKALSIINKQLKNGLSVPALAISLAGMGETDAISYANILMDFVRGRELIKKAAQRQRPIKMR